MCLGVVFRTKNQGMSYQLCRLCIPKAALQDQAFFEEQITPPSLKRQGIPLLRHVACFARSAGQTRTYIARVSVPMFLFMLEAKGIFAHALLKFHNHMYVVQKGTERIGANLLKDETMDPRGCDNLERVLTCVAMRVFCFSGTLWLVGLK